MSSSYQPPVAIQESKTIMHQMDVNKLENGSLIPTKEKLKDIRLRLSTMFQSTLDLDKLMKILFEELKNSLDVQSVKYHHETNGIQSLVGRQGKHQISYRLTSGEAYYGDIAFSRSRRIKEDELEVIESLMDLFVFPLRNALQYKQAIEFALTDPLTGVGNRQSMDKSLQHEVETAQRYQQPLSILMLDIDFFKSFNDRFGHQTGDLVLRSVASMIKASIRNSDDVFRYGGEEFLVILHHTELDQALLIAERIRSKVAKSNFINDGKDPITLSIGVAEFIDGTPQDLIKAADAALYDAKQGGRNQVRFQNPLNAVAQNG